MERQMTYSFTEEEVHVLAEALAMYASYHQECVLPMLIGDESDLDSITRDASISQSLARHFVEQDRGDRWEELSLAFQEYHDRPLDMSDVSDFDWHRYMNGELNK